MLEIYRMRFLLCLLCLLCDCFSLKAITTINEHRQLASRRALAYYHREQYLRAAIISKSIGEDFMKKTFVEVRHEVEQKGAIIVNNQCETPVIKSDWFDQRILSHHLHVQPLQQVVVLKSGIQMRSLMDLKQFEVDDSSVVMYKQDVSPDVPYFVKRVALSENATIAYGTGMWYTTLLRHNFFPQDSTAFVFENDLFDDLDLHTSFRVLSTIVQTCRNSHNSQNVRHCILFNTKRMQDDKERLRKWLMPLDCQEIVKLEYLSDARIHQSCLFIDDTFKDEYLIHLQI